MHCFEHRLANSVLQIYLQFNVCQSCIGLRNAEVMQNKLFEKVSLDRKKFKIFWVMKLKGKLSQIPTLS